MLRPLKSMLTPTAVMLGFSILLFSKPLRRDRRRDHLQQVGPADGDFSGFGNNALGVPDSSRR